MKDKMTFNLGKFPAGGRLDVFVRAIITPTPPRPTPETIAKVKAFNAPKVDILAWRKR